MSHLKKKCPLAGFEWFTCVHVWPIHLCTCVSEEWGVRTVRSQKRYLCCHTHLDTSVSRTWTENTRLGCDNRWCVCRYNERLKVKTDGSNVPRIHWLTRGTGTPKDRDEVNRREFWVGDGWVCVTVWSRALGVPSLFKVIRSAPALTRMLLTLDLICEENASRRKWSPKKTMCEPHKESCRGVTSTFFSPLHESY
jgi:hypothetical protein